MRPSRPSCATVTPTFMPTSSRPRPRVARCGPAALAHAGRTRTRERQGRDGMGDSERRRRPCRTVPVFGRQSERAAGPSVLLRDAEAVLELPGIGTIGRYPFVIGAAARPPSSTAGTTEPNNSASRHSTPRGARRRGRGICVPGSGQRRESVADARSPRGRVHGKGGDGVSLRRRSVHAHVHSWRPRLFPRTGGGFAGFVVDEARGDSCVGTPDWQSRSGSAATLTVLALVLVGFRARTEPRAHRREHRN